MTEVSVLQVSEGREQQVLILSRALLRIDRIVEGSV